MTIFENIQLLLKNLLKDTDFINHSYYVGGCVRDYIRNKDPHDIDMIVEKENGAFELSNYIYNKLNKYITTPINLGNYPIWSITFKENFTFNNKYYPLKDISIEIADTMDEQFHDINTRQRNVFFASIDKDILRRDFTINAGLMNIYGDLVYDIYNPTFLKDIQDGIIKCHDKVNPDKIFSDDPLRMLRAIIFAIRFDWKIEEKTKLSIIKNASRINIISKERIIGEINKIVNIPQGMYKLIIMLDEYNLLDKIFPDIYHLKSIYQQPDIRNIHLEGETVYEHTLNVLRNCKYGLINSLAALFHDVGKNEKTRQEIDGKIKFIGHEGLGANMTKNILYDLKYSNDIIKDVCFLIKHHMDIHHIKSEKDFSDKRIRRFIREIGDYKELLFNLTNADSLGTIIKYNDGTIGCIPNHDYEYKRIKEVIEKDKNIIKNKNIFNGNEIMSFLNIKGKDVGIAINILLELQDEFGLNADKEFIKNELIKKFNELKGEINNGY